MNLEITSNPLYMEVEVRCDLFIQCSKGSVMNMIHVDFYKTLHE